MSDYSRIRRQWLALVAGTIVGFPIALAVLISKLSISSLLGFGQAAAHVPQFAPCLSSVFALVMTFAALMILRKPRASAK